MSDTFGFTTTAMPPAVLGPRVRLGEDRVTDHAVHLGDQDTTVLIVEGSLADLHGYFRAVTHLIWERMTTQAKAQRTYREFFGVEREGLARGAYPLPPQSPQLGYDEDAALIWEHLGTEVLAYRRTVDEIDTALREPWTSEFQTRLRTEYLVSWPGDEDAGAPLDPDEPESVWRRFDDNTGLRAWLAAYALDADADPVPGKFFTIRLPHDRTAFQPLT